MQFTYNFVPKCISPGTNKNRLSIWAQPVRYPTQPGHNQFAIQRNQDTTHMATHGHKLSYPQTKNQPNWL